MQISSAGLPTAGHRGLFVAALSIFLVAYCVQPLLVDVIKLHGGAHSSTFLFLLPHYFSMVMVGLMPTKQRLWECDWKKGLVVSALDIVNQLLKKAGLVYAGAAVYIVVDSSSVVWTAVWSRALLKRSLSNSQWLAILLISVGIGLKACSLTFSWHDREFLGVFLILCSSVLMGLTFVLNEKFMKGDAEEEAVEYGVEDEAEDEVEDEVEDAVEEIVIQDAQDLLQATVPFETRNSEEKTGRVGGRTVIRDHVGEEKKSTKSGRRPSLRFHGTSYEEDEDEDEEEEDEEEEEEKEEKEKEEKEEGQPETQSGEGPAAGYNEQQAYEDAKAVEETLPLVLETMLNICLLDIEQSVRAAAKKVLKDTSVAAEERRARALGLIALGEIFQQTAEKFKKARTNVRVDAQQHLQDAFIRAAQKADEDRQAKDQLRHHGPPSSSAFAPPAPSSASSSSSSSSPSASSSSS
eukprot:GHVT01043884.1.p1 GENE.GHVT01043884.1~~GHVT01043884.1.p1  ORF type:complete len:464 (-),score=142.51 GHVT01043884.1:663-2054(-)